MARIRSIKPEFWTDPDIVAMPMAARLFFVGCWNHADDYGVLKDEPERLKLQIMPADDIDPAAIVDELVERRHLVRMIAPDGTRVLVVRTFGVHQKIDKRAVGRWGKPDDFQPTDTEPRPVPTDPAESPPDPHHSPPIPTLEGKGREGSGKENTHTAITLVEPTTTKPDHGSPPTAARVRSDFDEFWKLYPRKVSKPQAQKAYAKASKRADAETILAGLRRHLSPWETFEDHVIPHAATWLNGDRWNDDTPKPRAAPLDKSAAAKQRMAASIERLKAAGH